MARRHTDKRQVKGLVLTRRLGDIVSIETPEGEVLLVQVIAFRGNEVRLCFQAPDSVKIHRYEATPAYHQAKATAEGKAGGEE